MQKGSNGVMDEWNSGKRIKSFPAKNQYSIIPSFLRSKITEKSDY